MATLMQTIGGTMPANWVQSGVPPARPSHDGMRNQMLKNRRERVKIA